MHSVSHFLGKNSRMFVTILCLFLLPIVFNLAVIPIEAGSPVPAGIIGEALIPLTGLSLAATAIASAAICLSTLPWLAKLPMLLSLSFRLLLAASIAILFRYIAGVLMPLAWLGLIGDYLLGMPVSFLADRVSWYVVFPLAVVLFLLALHRAGRVPDPNRPPSGTSEAA